MRRVAPGYDLIHSGIEIDTPNERIIPGFMYLMYLNSEKDDIPTTKKFGVSFLLSLGFGSGDKKYSEDKIRNYTIRKDLFDRETEITIPRDFYVSRRDLDKFSEIYQQRVLPTDSKKWLFQTQYSIVIENCQQRNYLTEKLLHAFISMTIPIYIGCPNIGDYFDVRGMIIAENIDDIIKICKGLTPEKYAEMLPYLTENKKKAEEFLQLRSKYVNEFFTDKIIKN
jgi:hypothetical protein